MHERDRRRLIVPNHGQSTGEFSPRWSEDAFAVFSDRYSLYGSKLIAFFANRGMAADVAEDAAHDTWLKAYRSRDHFRDESFSGWLFTIARNHLVDLQRRAMRNPERSGTGDTAEPDSDSDARQETLSECLDKLEESLAKMIRRKYIDRQSNAEIAEEFGLTSVNAVSKRLMKARDVLRECMERKLEP